MCCQRCGFHSNKSAGRSLFEALQVLWNKHTDTLGYTEGILVSCTEDILSYAEVILGYANGGNI